MRKRIFTLTLAFLLCISLMPTATLADTNDIPDADEVIGTTEAPETEIDSVLPADAASDDILTHGAVLIEGSCGENLHYTLYYDNVLEITGTGEMTEHPWTDNDCPDFVREVHLPDGLTKICGDAFRECIYMQNIDIPDTVTEIGTGAFYKTGLTSLTLPKYLTALGMTVLEDTTGVRELIIPKTLTDCGWVNGAGPLAGSYVETLTFESGINIIPDNMALGAGRLTSVTIPATVTEIGVEAFADCISLESIDLPNKITKIGGGAFARSGLKSLTLPKYLTELGWCMLSETEGVRELTIPKTVTECGYNSVAGALGGSFVETLTFESGIKAIPYEIAHGAEHLTSVTIPDSTVTIENNAFSGCILLADVSIPAAVTKIGAGAFSGTALEEIDVPDSVTILGAGAFSFCESLKEIHLPDSLEELGTTLFEGCIALTEITIPEKIEWIWDGTFQGCTSLKTIHWNSAVTRINGWAFANSGLETVSIPDTVSCIVDNAFRNCDELTTVVIPNSVEELHNEAFADCDALTDVSFGLRLTTLHERMFESCDSLESLVLPVRMTEIQDEAFKDCVNFTEITIPPSVTSISDSAFSYPEEITVYGVAGSYAETYAKDKGMKFVATEIEEHEHTYVPEVITPATCTENGLALYTCTECGDSYEGVINAAGHQLTKTNAVPATCTKDGSEEYWTCTACGHYFADANGKTEIWEGSWIIGATGHTEVVDAAVPATCTADGKTEGSHCSVCNAVIKAQQTIKATGHTVVVDKAVAATCTTDGKTEGSHCSVCNTVIQAQQTIKAIGHSFSNDAEYCKNGCGTKNPDYVAPGPDDPDVPDPDKTDISGWTVTGIRDLTFTGQPLKQSGLRVSDDGEYADFTVKYKNNIDAGIAAIIITGTGDYTGTIERTFNILPKSITPTVILSPTSYTYDGKAKTPAVTVKEGETPLDPTQYTVAYDSGRVNVGTYKVTVTLTGNYKGTGTASFTIKSGKKTLNKDNIKAYVPSNRIYNGRAWKLTQVFYNNTELKEGKDYTVTYSNNINAGTATALVKGIGDYTGSVKCTYSISPAENYIQVSPSSKAYKYKTLKKSTKSFKLKATTWDSAKATFKLSSVTKKAKKYISVSSKGKVTVKKGLPKGKYTLKVKITSAATKNYKKSTVTKAITITVK